MTFRRTRCPHCKGKLESGQRIHPDCVEPWADSQQAKAERAEAKRVRAAAKVERAQIRARREAIKTVRQWLDECQVIANKIARIRDKDDGCISCDLGPNWQGQWHGSHFRSVGAASAVRLNLNNIHKACSPCNHHKSGNIAEYEPRLVKKIGQEKVDWLKAQNHVVRWRVEYLRRYKAVMGKRLRRMEKRL